MELREKAALSSGRESKKVKLGHSQQDLAEPTTLAGILFPPGPKDRVSVWIFPGYGETARFYLDLKMHESFLSWDQHRLGGRKIDMIVPTSRSLSDYFSRTRGRDIRVAGLEWEGMKLNALSAVAFASCSLGHTAINFEHMVILGDRARPVQSISKVIEDMAGFSYCDYVPQSDYLRRQTQRAFEQFARHFPQASEALRPFIRLHGPVTIFRRETFEACLDLFRQLGLDMPGPKGWGVWVGAMGLCRSDYWLPGTLATAIKVGMTLDPRLRVVHCEKKSSFRHAVLRVLESGAFFMDKPPEAEDPEVVRTMLAMSLEFGVTNQAAPGWLPPASNPVARHLERVADKVAEAPSLLVIAAAAAAEDEADMSSVTSSGSSSMVLSSSSSDNGPQEELHAVIHRRDDGAVLLGGLYGDNLHLVAMRHPWYSHIGWGCFAARDFEPGSVVGYLAGKRMALEQLSPLEVGYAVDLPSSNNNNNQHHQRGSSSSSSSSQDDEMSMQSTDSGSGSGGGSTVCNTLAIEARHTMLCHLMNDYSGLAEEPNVRLNDAGALVAVRQVGVGEELLLSYDGSGSGVYVSLIRQVLRASVGQNTE